MRPMMLPLALIPYLLGYAQFNIVVAGLILVFLLQFIVPEPEPARIDEGPRNMAWVPDQGDWVNSFLRDVWPRHVPLLESRIRSALGARIGSLKATGIHSAQLTSFRIVRGEPRVHNLRAYCEPALPGGTSTRARLSEDLDHVLDLTMNFDGLVDLRLATRVVAVGTVIIVCRLTHILADVQLRFFNRHNDRPFFGGYTMQFKSSPEPVFDLDIKVGYVDATRVPYVEEFVLNQLHKIIRQAKLEFRSVPDDPESIMPVFYPTGLLSIRVLGTSSGLTSLLSTNKNPKAIFEMTMGSQKKTCVALASSAESACQFIVSPYACSYKKSETEGELCIRLFVNGKAICKGTTIVEDAFRSSVSSSVDWEVTMKRSNFGPILKLRLLWEPLISPTRIHSQVMQKGMESVLRTLEAFPRGYFTSVGIIRVRIPSLALIDAESVLLSQNSCSMEWIPGVSVTLGDQSLAYSSDIKYSDPVCYFDENVTFDLLLSVTTVPSAKIILRAYNGRSLLGSSAISVSELIFVEGGSYKGEMLLDDGGHALLSANAEFFPTDFLLHLGHREQFVSAPSLQVQSHTDVRSASQASSVTVSRPSSPSSSSDSSIATSATFVSSASAPIQVPLSNPDVNVEHEIVRRTLNQIVDAVVSGGLSDPQPAHKAAMGYSDYTDDDAFVRPRRFSAASNVELSDMRTSSVSSAPLNKKLASAPGSWRSVKQRRRYHDLKTDGKGCCMM